MARIRTIKPDFFTSEQVAECSPNARLLFVGMWCFCDDHGVHPASPARLKMEVFPGDAFTKADVAGMVDELVEHGLLAEYEVNGELFWIVTGWKHQKIDKPSHKYPLPLADNSANGSRTLGYRPPAEGKGREEEVKDIPPNPPAGGNVPEIAKGQKPKRTAKIGLDAFLQTCREQGEKPIPADDAVFGYADRIGLPPDFVALAWRWFKARYADKRQAGVRGWRQTFRNAVEGNWPKYWFADDAGGWQLTTAGRQAQIAADADFSAEEAA
jgi:hypothetical protein